MGNEINKVIESISDAYFSKEEPLEILSGILSSYIAIVQTSEDVNLKTKSKELLLEYLKILS